MADDLLTLFTEDPSFPRDNIQNMVAHVKKNDDFTRLFKEMSPESREPMSIVHKWCADALKTLGVKDVFSHREKWGAILNQDIVGISQQFLAWLDLLQIDMLLFEDEGFREGVPRCNGEGIVEDDYESEAYLGSRRETQQFIVDEGVALFEERGWADGLRIWREKTSVFY